MSTDKNASVHIFLRPYNMIGIRTCRLSGRTALVLDSSLGLPPQYFVSRGYTLHIHKLFDDILGVSLSTLSATKVLPVKRTWRSQILMSLAVSEKKREMLHSCATHRDIKHELYAEKVETF